LLLFFILHWEHNGYQAYVLNFWNNPNGLFPCTSKSVEEDATMSMHQCLVKKKLVDEARMQQLIA
jgi:hypothetical protein